MENEVWTVAQKCPVQEEMTVSRDAGLGPENAVTWFSLGQNTEISQERYDRPVLYLGAAGCAVFLHSEPPVEQTLRAGELLYIPGGTLCGVKSTEGAVYTEIIPALPPERLSGKVKPGQTVRLSELLQVQPGSVVNLDLVRNAAFRYVLMAFDAGTGLQPHRAPGNAIVTAVEGSAVVSCEGRDWNLQEGESFRFSKNSLHSVTAACGPFKMSLLLVKENA